MAMLSSLQQVADALTTVTDNVGHYTAWDDTDRYIVWAEDGESAQLVADNYKPGQTIEGTIDYFTKSEDDENIAKIPQALNHAGIWWYLNSVQYEDDTRFIHYEWLFRVYQHISNEGFENANDQVQGAG